MLFRSLSIVGNGGMGALTYEPITSIQTSLIDLAFKELGLHKVELSCFSYNVQSQRVAEKLGFTLEARIRDRKDAQGNRCDDLRYGLLKSEWEVD